MTDFPALQPQFLAPIDQAKLEVKAPSRHPARILLLYGSLRERSFSRLLTEEAARIHWDYDGPAAISRLPRGRHP
jgi:arsenic resistance protein ArsH